jgi:hypothetical protein
LFGAKVSLFYKVIASMNKFLSIVVGFLFVCSSIVCAQQTVFDPVKIRRHKSAEKRVLVDKFGTLIFDDSAQKLIFKGDAGDHIDAGYAEIERVIFEVTTHMRGGTLANLVEAASIPGIIAGNAIAKGHVHDYWFYLEYKNRDRDESALIDVPKKYSTQVIEKARAIWGSRVQMTDFPETGTELDIEKLKSLRTKHKIKVDKKNHPMPEIKEDKATVVVVCPPLAARFAGTGSQVKLHANEQVIAVNVMGTYSFAYLDPGKYLLVSQGENANGFEMELEAGREYFFLQNTFQQTITPNQTSLSRNSPELVTFLLDGSYYSDWKVKQK